MQVVEALKEDEIDHKLLEKLEFFKGPLGVIPSSVRTMSYHPKLAEAFTNLNKAVMECNGEVKPEFKRLIGYVTSFASGCLYCQAHTILGAERFGTSEERLKNVWNYKESSAFSKSEKAALSFAFAASTVPNSVSKEIIDDLKEYWSDPDIIEIMAVISLFGYLNRWNDSMSSTLEDLPIEAGNTYLKETSNWNVSKHK